MDLQRTSLFSQIGQYMTVSGFVVLVYDYCLTLTSEVELIWSSKWTIIKVLYLIARYSVFIDLPLVVFRNVTPGISDHVQLCYVTFCLTVSTAVLSFGAAELILIWRTYALWGNSRKILVFLLAFFTALYAALTVCVAIYLRSVRFEEAPADFKQCWVAYAPRIIFIAFALVIITEAVILAFTLWVGFNKYRHSRNELINTLYRDGILYFVYMFLVSVGNIVITVTGPHELGDAMNEFQRVLQSLLSARVVLHVRQAAQTEVTTSESISGLHTQGRRAYTRFDTRV